MNKEPEWTDISEDIDELDNNVIEEVSIAIPQSQKGITAFNPVEEGFLTTIFDEDEDKQTPRNIKHGFFADIPIVCNGKPTWCKDEDGEEEVLHKGCPYYTVCPLKDHEEEMSHFCAIEKYLITNLVQAYAQDLGISSTAAIDISEIKDLIRIDVQLSRLDRQTQLEPDDFVYQITSYDQDGRAATRIEEHPKHQLRERLLNRKNRLLKDLMATRESYKSQISLTQYRKTASITAQERFARKIKELEIQNRKGIKDGTNS